MIREVAGRLAVGLERLQNCTVSARQKLRVNGRIMMLGDDSMPTCMSATSRPLPGSLWLPSATWPLKGTN